MRWVQAVSGDFQGTPPSPRSGHTSVRVGGSLVVVFGGLADKTFLQDITVLDTDNQIWFTPTTTGGGLEASVPSPRAFHVAVAVDCNMFVFGGRSGRKRLGDFWMLDTETWQWAELVGYGDLPPARDFAAGASVGDGQLVIYGGWDGSKWLSDVFVLNTISLEWKQLTIMGPTPSPRCGHSLIMVERRMLVFGGRGGGGPIMGDLWALKGLFNDENEPVAWTQLRLPGSAPASRCGHSISSGGSQLFIFGGHGTGGWLTRYDIYYNDVVVLDRASAHWRRLSVIGEPPPPRAYHSMTLVRGRLLLLGGYDGKLTHGDIWWLVSEDDPIGIRALLTRQPNAAAVSASSGYELTYKKENQAGKGGSSKSLLPLEELQQRLGLVAAHEAAVSTATETEKKEMGSLGLNSLRGRGVQFEGSRQVLRERWLEADPGDLSLLELDFLLNDYRSLISSMHKKTLVGFCKDTTIHQFYHLKTADEIRVSDIKGLLTEYKQLLSPAEMLN